MVLIGSDMSCGLGMDMLYWPILAEVKYFFNAFTASSTSLKLKGHTLGLCGSRSKPNWQKFCIFLLLHQMCFTLEEELCLLWTLALRPSSRLNYFSSHSHANTPVTLRCLPKATVDTSMDVLLAIRCGCLLPEMSGVFSVLMKSQLVLPGEWSALPATVSCYCCDPLSVTVISTCLDMKHVLQW